MTDIFVHYHAFCLVKSSIDTILTRQVSVFAIFLRPEKSRTGKGGRQKSKKATARRPFYIFFLFTPREISFACGYSDYRLKVPKETFMLLKKEMILLISFMMTSLTGELFL
jgi:hypothetical protein